MTGKRRSSWLTGRFGALPLSRSLQPFVLSPTQAPSTSLQRQHVPMSDARGQPSGRRLP
jgi:hypothetical protein